MIVPIQGQPINLEPYTPDDCNLGDEKTYCALYNVGDPLYLQFKQTSCTDTLIEDGSFESEVEPNPYWTTGSNWAITIGEACHSPGVAGVLSQQGLFDPDTDGAYYQVNFTITGMTGGTLEVSFDSDPVQTITENGIYTLYYTPFGSTPITLKFSADEDFDGCISEISSYALRRDMIAQVTNIDGDVLADISNYLQYDNEFVTLAVPDSSDMFYGSENIGNLVDGGCYKIYISEQCEYTEVVDNGDFADTVSETFVLGVGDASAPLWQYYQQSLTGDAAVYYDVDKMHIYPGTNSGDGGDWFLFYNTQGLLGDRIFNIDNTVTNILSFDLTNIATADGYHFWVTLIVYNAASPTTPYLYWQKEYDENGGGTTYGTITEVIQPSDWSLIDIDSSHYDTSASITFHIFTFNNSGGGPGADLEGDEYYIDNVSLKQLATGNPHVSNCLTVKTEWPCAKQIEGIETGQKLGFNFDTDFRLLQRLRTIKFNPEYPIDDNTSDYSDGSSRLSYAARKKFYTAKFDYMGETEHDTLSTQILCSDFEIDSQRYTVKLEDYKPEWDKEGGQQLAQSRLTVSKYGSNITNSGCQ